MFHADATGAASQADPAIPVAFFSFLYTPPNDSSDDESDLELPTAAADGTDYSQREGAQRGSLSGQTLRLLERRTKWNQNTSKHNTL